MEKTIDPILFVNMAKFIGSERKSEYECYTHHDRMKQKYKSFENIVKNLK